MCKCKRDLAALECVRGISMGFNRSKMEVIDRHPNLWKDLTLQIQFGMQITALPRA